jgi:Asp/Glu/hydantoin racemase
MLFAAMMGYKFGIVHISPYNIPETEEHMAKYGVRDRCAGLRPIEGWDSGLEEGLTHSEETIKAFKSTARRLIEEGAEVIIPGCSLMSPTVRMAPGAEDKFPGGLTHVEGAPLVDVLSVTLKTAEAMAGLYQAGSGWISRKLLYAQPPQRVLEISKPVTENMNFRFWDIDY